VNFSDKIVLGKTGLSVGRLGISSSFGAPAAAYEEAFERGCNYINWGTFIKGRSADMSGAVKNILKKGKRDDLIISMLSYAHNSSITELFLKKGLKILGIEYTDILLLGYFSKRPSRKIIDGALSLKEKGLIRFIGITGHNRSLFTELSREGIIDVFHVRYNAAHRGAETETFPFMEDVDSPGVVTFTATRWKQLLNKKKMPPEVNPPSAPDCYRFVLTHPAVDVCMMGAKTMEQMRENLTVLDSSPMTEAELDHMRKIGDHVYGKKKRPG